MITVLGNLYNEKTFEPVQFAHVINTRNYTATITDTIGNFSIKIRKKDTLLITSIGYENKKITFGEKNQQVVFKSIPMEEKLYRIKQVEVTPWGTYNEFKNRFMALDKKNPRDDIHPLLWKDLPQKPDEIEPYVPNITNPISFLYYIFSEEGKSKRKLIELQKKATIDSKIRSKYNREKVSDLTGLEGKELERFMKFCNFTDEYLLNTKEYKILQRVQNMYQMYSDSLNTLNQNTHESIDTTIQRH